MPIFKLQDLSLNFLDRYKTFHFENEKGYELGITKKNIIERL
jgi:hypothetical protein